MHTCSIRLEGSSALVQKRSAIINGLWSAPGGEADFAKFELEKPKRHIAGRLQIFSYLPTAV